MYIIDISAVNSSSFVIFADNSNTIYYGRKKETNNRSRSSGWRQPEYSDCGAAWSCSIAECLAGGKACPF